MLTNISFLQGNYHLQPHLDHASSLTTILISYNASKRGINYYPKPDAKTPHGIKQQRSKQHQSTVLNFTLPIPTSI